MVSPTAPAALAAPELIVRDLLAAPRVRRAFHFFETHATEITEEHAAICAIPAPPFGERERAEYLSARLRQYGLTEARTDKEGNCVALRYGKKRPRSLLVVS